MIVHISLSMRLCKITFVQILTISLDSVSGNGNFWSQVDCLNFIK